MTMLDLSHAPISAARLAAAHVDERNCPTCGLSGITPEDAAERAPRWMAAAELCTLGTPDHPSACCWDCRRMIAAGMDPAAIIAADHAASLRVTVIRCRPSARRNIAGAVDVDVTVTIAGQTIAGEVTLAPAQWGSRPLYSYGASPDHWVSGALLLALRRLDDGAFRAALDEIESASIEAAT